MQEVGKSRLKKYLLRLAVDFKTKQLKTSIMRTNSIWDMLVFNKIRKTVGGRVRFMITGSVPCSAKVLTFIRAAFSCVVLEGYGQMECVACASGTLTGDHNPDQVGPPILCCKIKLTDVPDMNFFAKDNRGEVCIWGYNVFQGYFKNDENTREVLDADGWLHTGDIGCWTDEDTLNLIDRKKDIFKLSQGEYIYRSKKIENVYGRSKFVAQCYFHGDSLKSCLVAIVVPDPDTLIPFAKKNLNFKEPSIVELCQNDKISKLIVDDMNNVGKMAGLVSFELVKDIHLYPEVFSTENGLLTPTFKSKRQALKEFFNDQISQMYGALH